MSVRKRIGELLREIGLGERALTEALDRQRLEPGTWLGTLLVRVGAVTEENVAAALASQLGLPFDDLRTAPIDPTWARKLGRAHAMRLRVMPLRQEGGTVRVATARPQDHGDTQELAFLLGRRVQLVVASPSRVEEAIQRHLGLESSARDLLHGMDPQLRRLVVSPHALQLDARAVEGLLGRGGTVFTDLVNLLIVHAVERRASDIHVEPQPDGVRIRFRVDGVLSEVLTLPPEVAGPLVSRLKVLGQMDVAERRRPQDGKVSVNLDERTLELRLAALPSQYGEKVVARLLDPAMVQRDFTSLGWPVEPLRRWYRLLSSPRGLLVVAGPTGSGKTTTLYASIHRLNQEGINIVTVEDPVEYALLGLTQVQVNEKAGVTFESSIRALLRQDPNVIIVGEVRDGETARAAFNAANTGHLVLCTLHADHAVGVITRLLDLDTPRYLLASALSGVVCQRLVRRLCPACSLPSIPTADEWAHFGLPPLQGGRVRRPGRGCPACHYMGYSGRVGLYELLLFTPAMGALIHQGASEEEIWEKAVEDGLHTLLEDALAKLLDGRTSLEELARVVDVSMYPRAVLEGSIKAVQAWYPVPAPAQASPSGKAVEPEAPQAEPADEVPSQEAAEELPAEASPAPRRGRPVALIVDDAEEIVSLVSLTLEDDFTIRSARDGLEALAAVSEEKPDLVVLDVMMPRMSGYEVCERLKGERETRAIPVIMLSARGERAHVKQGLQLGADDYLPKPFDPEELLLRCKALVRRSGWPDLA